MSYERDLEGGVPRFSEAAFERLYQETFSTVYAIARRAAREPADAEDVCQRAYLALYRYWAADKLREPPEHLLYRVAKNGAVDLLRRRRPEVPIPRGLAAGAPAEVPGSLDRALRRLRREDAALVLLQAAGGFSYDEIARIEGRTVSAVRSRLFRARRRLIELYEEEGGTW